MKRTSNAQQLLQARYLLRNPSGKIIETPHELFKRVAKHVASAEKKNKGGWEQTFYTLMANFHFLPNSPTLMNAGLPKGQLSACFVLPVEDSLDSIFSTLKSTALIHQNGGGTGYNFSKLRPHGDRIVSSGGTSSGPIAFIKIYNTATEHVKQGGKRRGANMGILNVDHPDIEAFILAKSEGNKLQNFNLSVGITNDFMKAVKEDTDWNLINPRTGEVTKAIRAKSLWGLIVSQAWKTGDPGLIFWIRSINTTQFPTKVLSKVQIPVGKCPFLSMKAVIWVPLTSPKC